MSDACTCSHSCSGFVCVCVTEKQRDHWLLYVNREIMLRGKLDVETGSEAQNDMFITRHKLWTTVELTSSAGFCLFQPQYSLHGKSPTYEPSGCKTSKMQTCICMFSRINSSCLWRTLSHTCILFCVIYCIIAVQHEELTNEDLMEFEAQRKDEERQEEEETEEPKSFMIQEMARGFYLFEEAVSFWDMHACVLWIQ